MNARNHGFIVFVQIYRNTYYEVNVDSSKPFLLTPIIILLLVIFFGIATFFVVGTLNKINSYATKTIVSSPSGIIHVYGVEKDSLELLYIDSIQKCVDTIPARFYDNDDYNKLCLRRGMAEEVLRIKYSKLLNSNGLSDSVLFGR